MIIAAIVLFGLAALLHVYIFALESLLWTRESTRATFGVRTEADARTTAPLAFNQGFYNLFLAVVAGAAVFALGTGHDAVGIALALAGPGSMVAAALVLVLSDRSKARAAAVQGTLPALGLITLALSRLG